MHTEQHVPERRQTPRHDVRATAVLHTADRCIHGRAMVVSDHALEVSCDMGFGVLSLDGAPVHIEMRLDGAAGTWFFTRGRISRVHASRHSVVIAIEHLPGELAAICGKGTARDDEHLDVLLVDEDVCRRIAVAAAFREAGCRVMGASTPLDAMELLDSRGGVDLIAVADSYPEKAANDLREYLDGAETKAEVIALGENDDWVATRERLDPSDGDGHLAERVSTLLTRLFAAPTK